MKFNKQSPLHVVLLCLILIFQFSCSKDSDLLTDYVLSDTSVSKGIANLVVDDTYQVSLSGSIVLDVLANDTFETGTEVVISETSTPANGTVAINNDETLTYTPNAEIIEQVSNTTETAVGEVDTFTYTVEVDNGEGTATTEEASVVITAADDAARQDAVLNISPWDYCQDGNPIGGGAGYDAIIISGDITITTSDTYSTLKTKIEAASSGDVVFINSNVSMDVSGLGSNSIVIPAGVTVGSNRGQNGSEGALIFSNDMAYQGSGSSRPIFVAGGDNIRITGFTMRGPYGFAGSYSPDSYDCAYGSTGEACRRVKFGITSNYDNTEIDNMHGYNWPFAFIGLSRWSSDQTAYGPSRKSVGSKIHHNYIHNNLQNGSGYGVDTENTKEVKIYGNMFHSHRHDIQNSGEPETGYEAYCNTVISEFPANTGFVLNGAVGSKVYDITSDGSGNTTSYNPKQTGNTHHNFDVHPRNWCNGDVYVYGLCDPPAGDAYYIHHNDFQDDGVARHNQTSGMQNISINGIPDNYGRIENNRSVRKYLGAWTSGGSPDYMVSQLFTDNLPNGITNLGNVVNGGD